MEAVTGAKPFLKRFLCYEEPYSAEIEVNRKRKLLQFESGNACLPSPKHKTLNRSATSTQEACLTENRGKENALEEIASAEIESEQGSNSFTNGGSDNNMSFEVNNYTEPFLHDLATFSFSRCRTREVNSGHHANLEGTTQARNGSIEDQHEYLDPIVDEFIEADGNSFMDSYHKDEGTDGMMLYSNDAAPFLHASDARPGTRKPTIDREFEQYFAALMM